MTENSPSPVKDESWDIVRIAMLAVAVALIVRMFFVQPFNIPSGSMRPNLLVGDFLYVSKSAYGYSRSSLVWPLTRMPVQGRVFSRMPKRGDVVVFKNKKDHNRDYIKRLIGMPGDVITVRAGEIFINNEKVQRDYLGTADVTCDGSTPGKVPVYRETLPNGVNYLVQECHGDDGFLDWKGPYTVPTGHFFVMGDNRDQSQDSRVEAVVGTVPFDDLVGRAERIFVSVDKNAFRFWQIWKWPSAIRGARAMKEIE